MKESQITDSILMIKPVNFAFNEQTAKSNSFMDQLTKHQQVHHKALREFELFVEKLEKNGINVLVVEDTDDPHSPDSVFPNNWISTHPEGIVFIYPMEAENRRIERRPGILNELSARFNISEIVDLSYLEKDHKFLEGTGSMVLDRENKLAYACLSSRTHTEALDIFCRKAAYKAITFRAFDENGVAIYHTNVMMCVGRHFAIVCLESVISLQERRLLQQTLEYSGKEIIEINFQQLHHFAGNAIQLKNREGKEFLVTSEQAFKSLSADQVAVIEKYCQPLFSRLYTIENTGGGSARCMIAEIFLHRKDTS